MAYGEVKLVPGVNTEQTPTLNKAGIATGNLIRWKEGLVEKIGGWERYYALSIGSIPRDLHPWQDLNAVKYLGIGATASLSVIANGVRQDITPQTTTTNTAPNFSTTSGSPTVQITDSNITNPTTNNSVFISTPVSIGGLVLFGLYPIAANISAHVYQITASSNATQSTTITNISAITQANPAVVTANSHGISATQLIYIEGVVGMTQVNGLEFTTGTVAANTLQLLGINSTGYTAYASGGTVNPATVPLFTTTSGSSIVNVAEGNHGKAAGDSASFLVSTTVGGVTISGTYVVQSVVDANHYTISGATQASSSTTGFMNAGLVRFTYYIAIGPQANPSPYGSGLYGAGAYGFGTTAPSGTGTPITALDWTQVNWGEILLACPKGGGIYAWEPNTGFQNAKLIGTGPIINEGIFIAMPFQTLIAYGSSKTGSPNPLQVSWCTIGDFTEWRTLTTDTAGNYQIPSGSILVGGLSVPQQQLLWTDIELWSMQWIGGTNEFGFSKIMSGCGLIGSHAMGVLGSTVYWMSQEQFFSMPAGGAPQPMPCTVWDYIFQDLDTDNAYKIRCRPNSQFNTIAWEFPSASGGSGENDSYVEYNAIEGEWTTGQFPETGRSAWTDQSVLGSPIGGTPNGLIFQHEVGYNGDGAAINPTFTSGWFVLGTGEDFVTLDLFIPDFKYGLQNGSQTASLLVTLEVTNYPNDTVTTLGPYTVTQASTQIVTRLRGRQGRVTCQSLDEDSFWRIGLIRYRFWPSGRR